MKKDYLRTLALLPLLMLGLHAQADKKLSDLTFVNGYYEIGSLEDMGAFSKAVNDGQTDLKGKLVADIDGFTEDYIMQETFFGELDGQGHSITLNINTTTTASGLFIMLRGTVQNLYVKGTIHTTQKLAGSIAAEAEKDVVVRNVVSEVDIYPCGGDATTGGIVGRVGVRSESGADPYFENCVFAGSIIQDPTNGTWKSSCLLGYLRDPGIHCVNCLVAPKKIDLTDNDNGTFSRKPQNCTWVNCFYTAEAIGQNQSEGTVEVTAEQLRSGEVCYMLNGDQSTQMCFYQNLGEDDFPWPFNTHAVVYSTASVSCDGSVEGDGGYTNDPAQAGKKQDHNFKDGFCSVCGTIDPNYLTADAEGWFNLADANALRWFSAHVNEGTNVNNLYANARLTADIDMAGVTMEPIGKTQSQDDASNSNVGYRGTFDGQGHVISNFTLQQDGIYAGLFGVVNDGAVVKNFIMRNAQISGKAFVGVIGGSNGGGTIIIDKVGFEGEATGSNQNVSGIIGVNMSSAAAFRISNCYVTGRIAGGLESGAISGWAANSSVSNCWSTAEVTGADNAGSSLFRGNPASTNNYSTHGQGNALTEEMVVSGELCCKLNGGATENVVWYQTLGEDQIPTFDITHAVVYSIGNYYANEGSSQRAEIAQAISDEAQAYVADLVAQQSLKQEYVDVAGSLSASTTIADMSAAYKAVEQKKAELDENAAAYKAYIDKVGETLAFLEANTQLESDVYFALVDYLNGNNEPSDENPNGEAQYIIENELLGTAEIKQEAARIDEWLKRVQSSDFKAGDDITSWLTNPDFANGYNGWAGRGGNTPSTSGAMAVAFTWNSTSDRHQTLTGLKDGIYEVRLKGSFFPYRSTDKIESTYYGAALYAGTNEVPIVAVSEEALPESEAQNQENCYIDNVNNLPYDYTIDRDGQTFYVPAHEVGAGYAFKGGRYENVMLVNVTDGRLTVGMRVDGTVPGGDLACFANVRLFYHGALSDEVESQTKAMQDVLAGQAARAQAIVDFKMSEEKDFTYYPNIPADLKQQLTAAIAEVGTVSTNEQRLALVEKFTGLFKQVNECRRAYTELGKAADDLLDFSATLYEGGIISEEEMLAKQNEGEGYWKYYVDGSLSAEEAYALVEKAKASTGQPALVNGYYEVENPIQWAWFVRKVAKTNNVNVALIADLDLTEYPQLPRLENFSGTMDGRDHKITIKLTATGSDYAFIQSAYNATFCNVFINGSVEGGNFRAIGGMVRYAEKSTFRRIYSTVDITSQYDGDISTGGILQYNGGDEGTKFLDCCYAGKMIVPKGTYVGPLVGHSGPIIEFENCLVAADVECTRVNCATICKSGTDGNVHVNNCYFKTALNITQGRYADENALASGEICYRLNADRQEPVWFQTIGVDPVPVLDKTHGIVIRNADGTYANTTGIEELKQAQPAESSAIYDLTGRRVGKAQRGIYIQGGRKVLVK